MVAVVCVQVYSLSRAAPAAAAHGVCVCVCVICSSYLQPAAQLADTCQSHTSLCVCVRCESHGGGETKVSHQMLQQFSTYSCTIKMLLSFDHIFLFADLLNIELHNKASVKGLSRSGFMEARERQDKNKHFLTVIWVCVLIAN